MYNNIALFLGHLVGDYWLQSDEMALNKSKKGWEGNKWCLHHCIIYSYCVSMFVIVSGWRTWCFSIESSIVLDSFLLAFLIAFVTHYPIDRISFAHEWMKWFGIVDFDSAPPIIETHEVKDGFGNLSQSDGKVNLRSFFVAPIYIAIDNSMHLVLMWILFSLLGK